MLRKVQADLEWDVQQGSTAVVVLLSDNHLVSANVGDSRALVIKIEENKDGRVIEPDQVIVLSQDHEPTQDEERNRIESTAGFSVVHGRVMHENWLYPNINLSRALGDFH